MSVTRKLAILREAVDICRELAMGSITDDSVTGIPSAIEVALQLAWGRRRQFSYAGTASDRRHRWVVGVLR
jgi:hypothetical protein